MVLSPIVTTWFANLFSRQRTLGLTPGISKDRIYPEYLLAYSRC